jgi:hypothetical protein
MERMRRRFRSMGRHAGGLGEGADVAGGCIDLEALLIAVVVIAVILLAIFFVIPLLLTLVDLVVVLLLTLLGFVAKIVFRRPWTLEARSDDGTVYRWKVVGWRASGQRRDEIAQMLSAGITPPDATVITPT